ncbi:hypothetical protein lerEdw1_020923 [Lerista edwardsae]|nr:hypothetical protein lerEdw1_020923 [Lerista edwardsae]
MPYRQPVMQAIMTDNFSPDDHLVHVKRITSTSACWTTLRKIYARDAVASKISLLRKLHGAVLQPGGSVKDHLRSMKQTFQELEELLSRAAKGFYSAQLT